MELSAGLLYGLAVSAIVFWGGLVWYHSKPDEYEDCDNLLLRKVGGVFLMGVSLAVLVLVIDRAV